MLISVIIITYNSSRFILQTLESVCRQSYFNIELIVSDDCSTDNTRTICREWLLEHQFRFKRAVVIKTPSNGGICKNYNFALQHAEGAWIKYIAGDDLLEENCIERFVANIQPNTFIYTCIAKHYYNESGIVELYSTRIPDKSAWKQARFMLKYLYGINGPTIFIERNHLELLGGFEEKYSMIEDWPIAIRFTTNGLRIGIIDEPLVQWRIYESSISHSNNAFAKSLQNAWKDYTMQYCLHYLLLFHKYHYWLNNWISTHNSKRMYLIIGYLLRLIDIVNIKRKIMPISQDPYRLINKK